MPLTQDEQNRSVRMLRYPAAKLDEQGKMLADQLPDGLTASTQAFTNASSVTVTHNKNRAMDITIVLANGSVVQGQIVQTSNAFTVSFNVPLTGTIYYR